MSLRAVTSLAEELLRRHVGGRAGADVFDGADRRQPEVHQPDFARVVQHDVGGLQVAMEDAALVRGGQPGAQLPRDVGGLVFREAADAAERRREVLAVHVFHRQVEVTVDLADVVDAADVGVRDLARRPDLVVELREPDGIGADRVGQELQRDRLAEAEVVGAVDLAHAALAEEADDAEPSVEHRTGREAAVIDRVGRAEPAA